MTVLNFFSDEDAYQRADKPDQTNTSASVQPPQQSMEESAVLSQQRAQECVRGGWRGFVQPGSQSRSVGILLRIGSPEVSISSRNKEKTLHDSDSVTKLLFNLSHSPASSRNLRFLNGTPVLLITDATFRVSKEKLNNHHQARFSCSSRRK